MTKRKLPPDIDGRNTERAEWAEVAIVAFMARVGGDRGDALADLLCDLRHWADRNKQDFERENLRGLGHYEAETGKAPY